MSTYPDEPQARAFALADFAVHDNDEPTHGTPAGATAEQLLAAQIGRHAPISTPLGVKPLVYADWTASARALAPVEAFLAREVLPAYGNTHTAASTCGAQASSFVAEARARVGEFCGARTHGKAASDVVLFCGHGATAATNRLVRILGVDAGWVAVVGPFEHHSNTLPWREAGAVVERAPARDGAVDLDALAEMLARHAGAASDGRVVGCFSATSNVTGIRTDVGAVAERLKRGRALAVFDWAPAAAHHPPRLHFAGGVSADALVFSGHKLPGGVGAPGVLVLRKELIRRDRAPAEPGGGTVFFASPHGHRFLSNRVEREQGGTPDVVGASRLALATATARACARAPDRDRAAVVARLRALAPRGVLVVLGGAGAGAPILSLLVRCGPAWLHHNFVCQLLNDLFGVQARGGCQCAGPYAHDLLGLTRSASDAVQSALLTKRTDRELLRPGFARVAGCVDTKRPRGLETRRTRGWTRPSRRLGPAAVIPFPRAGLDRRDRRVALGRRGRVRPQGRRARRRAGLARATALPRRGSDGRVAPPEPLLETARRRAALARGLRLPDRRAADAAGAKARL